MSALPQPEAQALLACTISRDVQIFDLLIEDMETAMGEAWGDLSFSEAANYLGHPDAASLKFITIAMDHEDEDNIDTIGEIIRVAKDKDIKVILITEDVSPAALHQLLREGGDEFVPYPLPEGELAEAIERVTAPKEQAHTPDRSTAPKQPDGGRDGVVIAAQGMSGGVGTTTFVTNLAWELANVHKTDNPKVCILDLDLQKGSISTYLDLPRREAVFELLADTEAMENETFLQSLVSYEETLQVLTAPTDMIPMDMLTPADIERLIATARTCFDYVIIDMSTTMVEWSQTVLEAANIYFAMIEMDMRSAQNTMRVKRALQSEELPFEKLRFVLNRAPGFTDLNGKSRIKRLAESLGISIEVMMPDGGKQVTQSNDHGAPMGQSAAKNALRKEIVKLAKSIHEINVSEEAVAKA